VFALLQMFTHLNNLHSTVQAMDSSHVSLCALILKAEGFDSYRCDKAFTLGVNTPNLAKILKCAGNDDIVLLKCEEETDTLTLVFESPAQDRISDFDFKLMDIESEHLGIPDTEYKCTVRMPSAEFQRIIRDISVFGDTCKLTSALDIDFLL
jgi:proliferating cell nuclear antigen